MKNNQGISLITLIVTIIVMIVLAAATARVATSGIDSAVDGRITNEKKEIETAIIKRFANFAYNSDTYPLIGKEVSLSDLTEIDGINIENIDYIREVNSSDLQNLGIKNTTGSVYIVDYLVGNVYGPIR